MTKKTQYPIYRISNGDVQKGYAEKNVLSTNWMNCYYPNCISFEMKKEEIHFELGPAVKETIDNIDEQINELKNVKQLLRENVREFKKTDCPV